MTDYSLLRRSEFSASDLGSLPHWDLFISAFNKSERVNALFNAVGAVVKHWVVHPEYDFAEADLPKADPTMVFRSRDEAECWHQYLGAANIASMPRDAKVCVDITGFMRPHLMVLPLLLRRMGFGRLDVLYSEPLMYAENEKTPFTKGAVTEVRQVRGFEGHHRPDAAGEDLLVIGAGYDDELIRRVAEDKRAARKLEMFGLPSLQPHMYEENRLRASRAEESVGPLPGRSTLFAPANDPFVTAQELQTRLIEERSRGVENIYLSPLATKVQALGFALYYLCECVGSAASIIFPYAEYYSHETSLGLSKVGMFELELDWLAI